MKSHALNTCVNTCVNKKVALDLRVHSRVIENRIVRTIRLHLRYRKMDCEQYIARVALYLVGYQRVQVRMEVEIFAEGVDRHDDGRNAIVRRVANAACGTRPAEFFNGWERKRMRDGI